MRIKSSHLIRRRVLAAFVEYAVVNIALTSIVELCKAGNSSYEFQLSEVFRESNLVLFSVIWLTTATLSEYLYGRTLGELIFGLRVQPEETLRPTKRDWMYRLLQLNVFKLFESLVWPLIFFGLMRSAESPRSIGDKMTDTIVVDTLS